MQLWAFWEQPLRWPAPHFTCATNNPDYIFLWHSEPAPDDRWASSKALQLARVRCNCLPQQHAQLRRLLLSFPKRKLRRQVYTNCVIHETYVSQRLTNQCFVPNPICHTPTGGRPTVTMQAPHLSFILLCSFSSSLYATNTIPYNFWYLYNIIKLRMWRDGSRLAAVCLGRWKFVGPRRSSLHSVRFGQLLVTLCTSTHCQCNESVHRKELLLFTPFKTV